MSLLKDITENSGVDNIFKALQHRNDGSADGGLRSLRISIYSQYFSEAETIKEIAVISDDLKIKLKEELSDALLAWQALCSAIDEVATMRMEAIYNNTRENINLEPEKE